MGDSICFHTFYMGWKLRSIYERLQTRNQTLQNQSSLTRTGNTGNYSQLSFWDLHLQRFHSVDSIRQKMNPPMRKYTLFALIQFGRFVFLCIIYTQIS